MRSNCVYVDGKGNCCGSLWGVYAFSMELVAHELKELACLLAC